MEATSDLLAKFGIVDINDLPSQLGVRSTPFEPHLELADGPMHEEAKQLANQLVRHSLMNYSRLPSPQKQLQFAECINLILLNLVRAEIRSKGLAVGIGTSKQRLDASRRYLPTFISVDYFLKARDLLLYQNIMTIAAPGYRNDGLAKVARYCLTDTAKIRLLADAPPLEAFRVAVHRETMILKDAAGQLAKYKDDTWTTTKRAVLARINANIAAANIGSTRPIDPMFDLEEGYAAGNIRLYRVFNNGAFDQGGRFYGGWWQYTKRHFRPSVTINNEATIEADFSGLHPSMLFARRGLPIPNDPYALVPGVGDDAILRDHAKTTFLALLNAGRRGTKEPRNFDDTRHGMSGKEFRAKVRGAFPMLPNIFGSSLGLHLQREDSDLAEKIMLHFVDRGIPILPIHDSFIVAQCHRNELVSVMIDTFKKGFRQDISVTVKG